MRKGRAHIQELLQSIEGIAAHLERLSRDQGLLGEVRSHLPVHTRPHCLEATLGKDGMLTLILDSSSWATRVRYLELELALQLAELGVTAVRTRVMPPGRAGYRQASARLPLGARRLTPAAVGHLLEAADHMADPGLAEALRHLAGTRGRGD